MMKILIPKFSAYQHYGKRNPPWIKLHRKILEDQKFWGLKPQEQILLVAIWLMASENALEEGQGVLEVNGMDEINWRLRCTFPRKALDALKSSGFIEIEGDASKALATRKQHATPETETETETEGEGENDLAPPSATRGGPAKKSWAREAAEDWDDHFGYGSSHPGRIGAALTGLVKKQGWAKVRPVWQRYIEEKDPQFASPQDFVSKFGVWAEGTENRVGGRAIEKENARELGRFLGPQQKRLPSEPTSATIPRAKDRE